MNKEMTFKNSFSPTPPPPPSTTTTYQEDSKRNNKRIVPSDRNESLVKSEADALAFSKKPRHVQYE